jgi:Tol biopolymer transport system component
LSPDNQRLALTVDEEGNQDVWIADPDRDTMSRLTFEPTIETMPTWSPDGRFVAFRSERERPGVFRRAAQGTGTAERLTATDGPIHSPYSWTPDGRTLMLAVFRSFRHQAIGSVTPPETTVRILLDGDFAQLDPQVSPDGRWLAYQSDETGRFEVYVRPYPDIESGRWLISSAGGTATETSSSTTTARVSCECRSPRHLDLRLAGQHGCSRSGHSAAGSVRTSKSRQTASGSCFCYRWRPSRHAPSASCWCRTGPRC